MPKNQFVNFYTANNEQTLYSNMVREAIKFHGEDFIYIPRIMKDYDKITGRESISVYEKTYPIECYVDSYNNYQGMGAFMSEFGQEQRDQMTLIMHRVSFEEEVTRLDSTLVRPNDGDLLYFPIGKKCFQISYIEPREHFYQLGSMPTYKIHVSLFEYNSDIMNTGIEEIDRLQNIFSFDVYDYALLDEDGNYLLDENNDVLITEKMDFNIIDPFADNDEIHEEADDIIDWSEGNQLIRNRY